LKGLPTSVNLGQNYPNPFNPVTSISFDLIESVQVRLQVFDTAGRVVANLVDGMLNAGRYTASFSASELPSGTYYYRLVAGNYTATKSMILLK